MKSYKSYVKDVSTFTMCYSILHIPLLVPISGVSSCVKNNPTLMKITTFQSSISLAHKCTAHECLVNPHLACLDVENNNTTAFSAICFEMFKSDL